MEASEEKKSFAKKPQGKGDFKGKKPWQGTSSPVKSGGQQFKRKRSQGDFSKNGPSPKKQKGPDGEGVATAEVERRGIKRQASSDPKNDKREQKRLKREKKLARPNGQMAYDAKALWEEIRQKKISEAKRTKNISQLLDLIQGKMFEIVTKRDTSRVIQSVLKHGTPEQRQVVFEELKDHVVEMAQNNYAHFIINKMLMYGDKDQQNLLIKQFYGKVRKLAKHKEASQVLEYIYNSIANSQQKSALIEEFYGPQFSLFKSDEVRTLESILEKEPQKKRPIVQALKEYLIDITNKAHAVLGHGIVHVPLLKFFENATYDDVNEFLPFIRDHIVRILHTKEGARVACHIVGYGRQKDRKTILKSFKSYITKICKEEFGHLVLLKAFECVDDTSLLNKVVISEMIDNLLEIVKDKYGRLVVFAALQTPTTKYFYQTTLDILQPTMVPDEENRSQLVPSSKKEESVRRSELRAAILPALQTLCQKSAYEMITDMFARNVFEETYALATAEEDREKLNTALLQWVARPADADDDSEKKPERTYHPMEQRLKEEDPKEDLLKHTLAHRIVRRLVEEDGSFATRLLSKVRENLLDYALEKSSSWVLLSLLEKDDTAQNAKKLLIPLLPKLQAGAELGSRVLVQKLTGQSPQKREPTTPKQALTANIPTKKPLKEDKPPVSAKEVKKAQTAPQAGKESKSPQESEKNNKAMKSQPSTPREGGKEATEAKESKKGKESQPSTPKEAKPKEQGEQAKSTPKADIPKKDKVETPRQGSEKKPKKTPEAAEQATKPQKQGEPSLTLKKAESQSPVTPKEAKKVEGEQKKAEKPVTPRTPNDAAPKAQQKEGEKKTSDANPKAQEKKLTPPSTPKSQDQKHDVEKSHPASAPKEKKDGAEKKPTTPKPLQKESEKKSPSSTPKPQGEKKPATPSTTPKPQQMEGEKKSPSATPKPLQKEGETKSPSATPKPQQKEGDKKSPSTTPKHQGEKQPATPSTTPKPQQKEGDKKTPKPQGVKKPATPSTTPKPQLEKNKKQ